VDLGGGVTLSLVPIPAGEFTLGDTGGQADEQPTSCVTIARSFWMGVHEVTNEQFRRFRPSFDARTYNKRHARHDDQGLPLDDPRQPAVGVSWREAMEFCHWLTQRTGRRFTLPTEAQWEWACRAGSTTAFAFGGLEDDFAPWANLADVSFGAGLLLDGSRQKSGGVEHLSIEGAELSDRRYDDRAVVTAPVGTFRPNAWGLYDLHGNAAEWTRSAYRPYPYQPDDGREVAEAPARRVVRGGSFFDPPRRSRSAARLDYPDWQRVFNVGFRVVAEMTR
jgi:formylglycine-generating enzyme required for sulfatase activity